MSVEETLKERNPTHGKYTQQAATHDALLVVLMKTPNFLKLNAAQRQALNLISMKMSRILHGDADHQDHWHDISGYAKLGEENCAPDENQGQLDLGPRMDIGAKSFQAGDLMFVGQKVSDRDQKFYRCCTCKEKQKCVSGNVCLICNPS